MKRKIRRFREGGDYESSDDYKNLQLAADREAVEYEGEKIAKPLREAAKSEPLRMASFKEAFKEARERGDKTFEYMGKKYSTELAKPKSESSKPSVKEESTEKPKSKSFAEKQEAAGEKMRGAYRGTAESIRNALTPTASNPRISRELTDIRTNMKKGGTVKSSASKRADGIARRGKTRGRMV